MNKLALAAAVSAVMTSPAFAVSWYYPGLATSGTAANPLASIVVSAGVATAVYYVDPASGTASNITTPATQLVNKASTWTFDFTNLAAVAFTGNIVYGDYRTQTSVTGTPTIDGRQSFTGVTQSFSGVGAYDEATNTLTYNFLSPSNLSGGSVQTQTSSACANGKTNTLGKVCTAFVMATANWEGLALSFVFAEDRLSFAGSLQGTEKSGSGLTAGTTKINWQVQAVPVPAAAWLFGSGLAGLAGASRRRRVV